MGKTMTPGRKRVVFRAMAVLVIVLGVTVVAFMTSRDPREAEARRLIEELEELEELQEPSAFRKWLVELGVIQLSRERHPVFIVKDLAALGQPAVPVCIRALKDDDYYIRFYAAVALGQMDPVPGEAVPLLIQALKDERSDVRRIAAWALGQIDAPPKEAVPALAGALEDESPSVRWQAAEALTQIGPRAQAAIPALTKALKDENYSVRKTAAEALKKIQAAATRPAATTQPGGKQ